MDTQQTERARKVRLALERAALFWKIIGDAGVPTSLGMKIGSAKFEALGDDEKFLLAKVANDLVKADAQIKAAIEAEKATQEAAKEAPPDEPEKQQEEPEPKTYFGGRLETHSSSQAQTQAENEGQAEIDAYQDRTEVAPAVEIRRSRKAAQTT